VKSFYEISDTGKNSNISFETNDAFGRSVSAIGDIDKNGITDILAAAFMRDDGGIDNGAIWISLPPCQLTSNAGVDLNSCERQQVFLNGNVPLSGAGEWTILEGMASVLSPKDPQSEVTNLSVGVNKFVWTVSRSECPPVSDTVEVRVMASDEAFAGDDHNTCGNSIALSATAPVSGNGNWRILKGSGNLADSQSASTSVTDLGKGLNQIVWEILHGFCPVERDTVNIVVHDGLSAVINPGNIFACEDLVAIKAEPFSIGSGKWNVVEGSGEIQNADSASTTIKIKDLPIKLTWIVTHPGCDTVSDSLSILPALTKEDIPNVITPNGDDKNQFWDIKKLKDLPENSVRVYNRWGYSVFEAVGYSGNWSGGELSSGTYFYHVNIRDCKSEIRGWLHIIR
jgi:gliding motility-associated-like protein